MSDSPNTSDRLVEAPAAEVGRTTAIEPAESSVAEPRAKPARKRRGRTALEELENLEKVGSLPWTKTVPSWGASALFHAVVLVILALLIQREAIKDTVRNLVATTDSEETEELEDSPNDSVDPVDVQSDLADAMESVASLETTDLDLSTLDDAPAPMATVELTDIGLEKAPVNDLTQMIGTVSGRGFEGRGAQARKAMVAQRGGSDGSEKAVAMALAWFAEHQLPDGSWSFNHHKGACQGRCGNPGTLANADIAATAMALLPFLGAGQTHLEGKYKRNVQGGLAFLVNSMKVGPTGGDMSYDGGRMYGHGLASIAICEALAMTEDRALIAPAQQALNYIVYAQDPVGGGWRYTAGDRPGDTSVVGWQLMALKSGHMAYLSVPPLTIKGVTNFLNTVQTDDGAAYGYIEPARRRSTTAIGLLCRMYLGWRHTEPALIRGVDYLAKEGPSPSDMYYNYYATQVLHHFEGEEWEKWNARMRDYLIDSQNKEGHEAGSWYFAGDPHNETGGRLYTTSLATMTLEVYYRHLPIYGKEVTDDEFVE